MRRIRVLKSNLLCRQTLVIQRQFRVYFWVKNIFCCRTNLIIHGRRDPVQKSGRNRRQGARRHAPTLTCLIINCWFVCLNIIRENILGVYPNWTVHVTAKVACLREPRGQLAWHTATCKYTRAVSFDVSIWFNSCVTRKYTNDTFKRSSAKAVKFALNIYT